MVDIFIKQYVIASFRIDIQNMKERKLKRGYLYYHEQMNCVDAVAGNQESVIILGNAYCVDSHKEIAEDVIHWNGESLQELTKFWTGRWLLIYDNELITDPTGLMSAFYYSDEDEWIVSSSLAVMSRLLKRDIAKIPKYNFDWVILPDSSIEGVHKLLSTQKILVSEKSLYTIFYQWVTDYTALSTDKKCVMIRDALATALKNISDFSRRKIYLALTGGKDSREVLSILFYAGLSDFCTYTFAYPGMWGADRKIPKLLAKEYGFTHHYIKRKCFIKEKEDEYNIFTGSNIHGADEKFYAYGQFEEIPSDVILIRSGLFEAAQSFARGYINGSNINQFALDMKSNRRNLLYSENQIHGFEKWVSFATDNPIDFVDIRDRFYVEQRFGGWAAAIEQSMDMNDFVSIQIANCPHIISLLLSANQEEREELSLCNGVIKCSTMSLLDYPVNKKTIADWIRYYGFSVIRKIF